MHPKFASLSFVGELGEGTTGSRVYLYKKKKLLNNNNKEELVVVKQRRLGGSRAHELGALREAQLLREFVMHPCILRFVDAILYKETLCIMTVYAEGGDLSRAIQHRLRFGREPFPMQSAQSWIAQIALGLEALHSKGVLHRDVKPANVMILKDNRVVLGDFGVSRMGMLAETRTGTPLYMSPELFRGDVYGTSSDVWAFGCLAFEVVTLHRPFKTESFRELRGMVENGKVAWHRYARLVVKGGDEWTARRFRRLIRGTLATRSSSRPTMAMILKEPVVALGVAALVRDCTSSLVSMSRTERRTLFDQFCRIGLADVAACSVKVGKLERARHSSYYFPSSNNNAP